MEPQLKQLRCEDYHVMWVCPGKAVDPARLLFDVPHKRPDYDPDKDDYIYYCGSMRGHNVVLASSGRRGNVEAARMGGTVFNTFPNIKLVMIIGTGGGVPSAPNADAQLDIHLGDVVVGYTGDHSVPAVVHFDSGRHKENVFETHSAINRPPPALINGLNAVENDHRVLESCFKLHLKKLQDHESLGYRFKHPGLEYDILYKASYPHQVEGQDCRSCDDTMAVVRQERKPGDQNPFVFHKGRIATGSYTIERAQTRDDLSKANKGIQCFEMSAAGIDSSKSCLIIRGISDYCDSHRNPGKWTDYASAKAAVFGYELLSKMPTRSIVSLGTESLNVRNINGQLNNLRARRDIYLRQVPCFEFIQKEFGLDTASHPKRLIMLNIHGLPGSGKSEVCLDYIEEQESTDRFSHIIWIDASTPATIKNSLDRIRNEFDFIRNETRDYTAFFEYLSKATKPWLMVLDNVESLQEEFTTALLDSNHGRIITTSQEFLGFIGRYQLTHMLCSMDKNNGLKLLARTSGNAIDLRAGKKEKEAAEKLVSMLGCHPFAITVAGTLMQTEQMRYNEYLHSWYRTFSEAYPPNSSLDERGVHVKRLQATLTLSHGKLRKIQDEETAGDAEELLQFLSFMHRGQVHLELFQRAWKSQSKHYPGSDDMRGRTLRIFENPLSNGSKNWESSQCFRRLHKAIGKLVDYSFVRSDRDAIVNLDRRSNHTGHKMIYMHAIMHTFARTLPEGVEAARSGWRKAASTISLSLGDHSDERFLLQNVVHLDSLGRRDRDLHDRQLGVHNNRIQGVYRPGILDVQLPYHNRFEAANRFADTLSISGYFNESLQVREALVQEASMSFDTAVPENRQTTAKLLFYSTRLLADTYSDLIRHQDALVQREKAESLIQSLPSQGDEPLPETLIIRYDKAESWWHVGERLKVYNLVKDIVDAWEAHPQKDQYIRHVLRAQCFKATILFEYRADIEPALKLIRNVTDQYYDTGSSFDNDRLHAESVFADILFAHGDKKEAYKKRKMVFKQRLGTYFTTPHIDMIVSKHKLADSYYHLKRFSEAKTLRLEVRKDLKRVGKNAQDNHAIYVAADLALAQSYLHRETKDLEAAMELLESRSKTQSKQMSSTMNISEVQLADHIRVEMKLSLAYCDYLESRKSPDIRQKALRKVSRLSEDQKLSRALQDYPQPYKLQVRCLQRMVFLRLDHEDDGSPMLWNKALQESEIRATNDVETIGLLIDTASTFHGFKYYNDAATVFESAWQRAKSHYGEDHGRTRDLLEDLVRCYRKGCQLDKAVKYQEELIKTQCRRFGADSKETRNEKKKLAYYKGALAQWIQNQE